MVLPTTQRHDQVSHNSISFSPRVSVVANADMFVKCRFFVSLTKSAKPAKDKYDSVAQSLLAPGTASAKSLR